MIDFLGQRKPIQICAVTDKEGAFDTLYALCEDGSIWIKVTPVRDNSKWKEISPIPNDDKK